MKHTVQEEFKGILLFVASIWCMFFVQQILPFRLSEYGVTPRTWGGLLGIPVMPFLHANYQHLLSNTAPLVVLLVLLAGSRANSWRIVVGIILMGGSLLWLFGRYATHIGASGLIFGLIAFLVVAGFLERRLISIFVAILVGFLYGGALLTGMIPHFHSSVSWDGHLCGAVAGVILVYLTTRHFEPREKLPIASETSGFIQ